AVPCPGGAVLVGGRGGPPRRDVHEVGPMTKALFVFHTAAPSGAELGVLRLAEAMRAVNATNGDGVEISTAFIDHGPIVDRMRACGINATILRGTFNSRAMTIQNRSL